MDMDCRTWLPDPTLSGSTRHKMKKYPKEEAVLFLAETEPQSLAKD